MKNFTSHLLLAAALFVCTLAVTVSAQKLRKDFTPITEDCLSCTSAQGLAAAPDLGAASTFSVLAGTTVTNTGASIVTGNLGVSPGTAVTGFPPGTVVAGTIHAGGPTADAAHADAAAAWNTISLITCDTDLTGQDLGGLTLTPGTYCFDTSAQLTGTLTLNGLGDPDAVFIFQIGSTLTTSVGSSVVLTNSAKACNIYYGIGSSGTIGVDSVINGNLIALTSMTLNGGADVTGRVIAIDGAVTLDTNDVVICNFNPSAASVDVSGRVIDRSGRSISRATVILNYDGKPRSAVTNTFGWYKFTDIDAGETVVLQVKANRYTFPNSSLVISMSDSVTDANFRAN